jgi:kynurenine formamidase
MKKLGVALAAVLIAALGTTIALAHSPEEQARVIKQSQGEVPAPPWSSGDQRGMANTQGIGTWRRCAYHLTNQRSKAYELSHLRSGTMPQSPFGKPLKFVYRPTASIPGSRHAFNDEHLDSGQPGAQGTQFDALGHFAYLDQPWDGKSDIPVDTATYYNGYKQSEVKPTPDSRLLKLGMENVPPIITSAVLLDAKSYVGGGEALKPGQVVSAADIEGMLAAQGLRWRGILPGDVLYIYTGWGDGWKDPAGESPYYFMGPGLSYDAAKYIAEREVVLVSLDNPFTDPVADGMLQGKAPPAKGTPAGLPFAIHHHNLAVAGIHQIQNANLGTMARDKVWTSCTMILPLLVKGGAGSPARPIAIGAPNQ